MNPIYISPTGGDVFIPMGGTPLSEGADALALLIMLGGMAACAFLYFKWGTIRGFFRRARIPSDPHERVRLDRRFEKMIRDAQKAGFLEANIMGRVWEFQFPRGISDAKWAVTKSGMLEPAVDIDVDDRIHTYTEYMLAAPMGPDIMEVMSEKIRLFGIRKIQEDAAKEQARRERVLEIEMALDGEPVTPRAKSYAEAYCKTRKLEKMPREAPAHMKEPWYSRDDPDTPWHDGEAEALGRSLDKLL